MKYCCTNKERVDTSYFQFHIGKWNDEIYWSEHSLYIEDIVVFRLGIEEIFKKVISEFDLFSNTEINELQWKEILKIAKMIGGEEYEVIMEINDWASQWFKEYDIITFMGV